MMLSIVLTVFCWGLALPKGQVSYTGWQVYNVTLKSEDDIKVLDQFKYKPGHDFWSDHHTTKNPIMIMVSPENQAEFEKTLKANNIHFNVVIGGVERTIQSGQLRMADKIKKGTVSFTKYMRLGEIHDYLHHLEKNYSSIAKTEVLGKSYEGRELLALRISSDGSKKPTIFIDAGIHPREWIAPPTALYIIHQLVENPKNAAMYKNVDWVVLPCLNPDGYEFTHTHDRFWRKTRSLGSKCKGVDMNRNFDFHWGASGTSRDWCSDIHRGQEPMSETEAQALSAYFLENKDEIKLYLTFHSFGQYILYPWGYAKIYPEDKDELHSLAESVSDAISSVSGTKYEVGTSGIAMYPAAGGSDDYAKGVAGIQLAYTIELPGGGRLGFDAPTKRILPIVQETWEGMKDRFWRKTRTPYTPCYGVDANRNFDFHWTVTNTSSCFYNYQGPNPFSEKETQALRDYFLVNKNEIKLYLTFHSYGRYILYPWAYTSDPPENFDKLDFLARAVSNAIGSVSGTTYTVGSPANIFRILGGISADYAKGVAGIQYVYSIELPRGGSVGFDPPPTRILPIVEEIWEGVKVYHQYIEKHFVN